MVLNPFSLNFGVLKQKIPDPAYRGPGLWKSIIHNSALAALFGPFEGPRPGQVGK